MPQRRNAVILAGSTGHIGRAVAAELLSRAFDHALIVRPSASSVREHATVPHREIVVAELTEADRLGQSLQGLFSDTVISCIASRTGVPQDAWNVDYRANLNLLEAAKRNGVRHFILLSAICVQKPRLEFQAAKLAFEAELCSSGIDYTIIRPTAFFKSLSGQVERVLAGKPFLLFGDGELTSCKPISEKDLAELIVNSVEDPTVRNRILPVGGPGAAITPREQGELLFRLAGVEPRFRRVPVALFSFLSRVLHLPGKLIPALAAKAELARIAHYYATESMLVWDEDAGRYDPSATPEYGTARLEDHYERLLKDGISGYEAGEQRLF